MGTVNSSIGMGGWLDGWMDTGNGFGILLLFNFISCFPVMLVI